MQRGWARCCLRSIGSWESLFEAPRLGDEALSTSGGTELGLFQTLLETLKTSAMELLASVIRYSQPSFLYHEPQTERNSPEMIGLTCGGHEELRGSIGDGKNTGLRVRQPVSKSQHFPHISVTLGNLLNLSVPLISWGHVIHFLYYTELG